MNRRRRGKVRGALGIRHHRRGRARRVVIHEQRVFNPEIKGWRRLNVVGVVGVGVGFRRATLVGDASAQCETAETHLLCVGGMDWVLVLGLELGWVGLV